ncbi:hypothetical protein PMO31116_00499 [Pandoraea morbifera]|uniref:Uncharacterized protein n=1 Tax=Pandoraea morbifera TaxID=2508300 RepID=A0A5E4RZQ9_9BURK|nr:hypothetical protein [Pandoraea morbifera]VVD68976.1 hypothetical protein PMO31116_00499 [Pandoraea morbifera]
MNMTTEEPFDVPFTIILTLGDYTNSKTYKLKAWGKSPSAAAHNLQKELMGEDDKLSFEKLELLYKYSKLKLVN